MTITVRKSGTLRPIVAVTVRKSGTLRVVTDAWVRKSGTLRKFLEPEAVEAPDPLTANATGGIAYGSCTNTLAGSSCTATTTSVVAHASGGTAPYSYRWDVYSDSYPSTPISFTDQFAASTHCERYAVVQNEASATPKSATVRCRVTDAVGAVTYTGTVQVSTTHIRDTGV